MKRSVLFLGILLAVVLLFSGLTWSAQEEAKKEATEDTTKAVPKPVYKYMGAASCKGCHNLPKTGKQFNKWSASEHAHAYHVLASDQAKALAKEMKIEDAQKSEKCLGCHVTAYGVADSLLGAKYSVEDGVTCEACHGPGEKYKPMKVMKDRKLALKNGLIIPTEETCVACHNEKSPTFKAFKFEEKVKAIDHSYPKVVEEKK